MSVRENETREPRMGGQTMGMLDGKVALITGGFAARAAPTP